MILRLSAWGARALHELHYRFPLFVNWLPGSGAEKIARDFQARRETSGAKLLVNVPPGPLPLRLWNNSSWPPALREARAGRRSRGPQAHALTQQLVHTELAVTGAEV